jgi:hypothetical protein
VLGCVGMVNFCGNVLRSRDERLDGFGNLGSMADGKVNHARHGEFVGEAWNVK